MVGYAPDAMRFMGATFDPSGLYRFNAVQRMLRENDLSTAMISGYVAGLQQQLVDSLDDTALAGAELLNPPADGSHARFLAFRSVEAQRWCAELKRENCIVDVRGDVLRIGLGLYHDEADILAFARLAPRS
jgi:selenocysteine lyase/cysteine desulfurase